MLADEKRGGKDLRWTLRHISLLTGATVLLLPQIAIGGFFDFFVFTPTPPFYDLPFAVGTAGATIQIDLRVKKERGWYFILTFAFDKDTESASAFKLMGHAIHADGRYDKNELGIDTPVLVEIERLDAGEAHADDIAIRQIPEIDMSDARPIHPGAVFTREIHPHGVIRGGEYLFERALGLIMFKPGKYRIYLTALKEVPEVQSLETSFSIQDLAK